MDKLKGMVSKVGLGAATVMCLAVPAFADTHPVPDYAGMVSGARSELYTSLTAVGPAVFGLLGVLSAIGLAWKLFKRAARSS